MEIQERVQVPEDWDENPFGWFPKPPTQEAYYYRMLFEKNRFKLGDPWEYWMPKWSPETNDPSARTLAQ
jgi:hypothetical protein